jgi:hypothetical protein
MTDTLTIFLLVELGTLRLRVALLEGKDRDAAIEDARSLMTKWMGTLSRASGTNESQRAEFQRLFDRAVQNALDEHHRSGPL